MEVYNRLRNCLDHPLSIAVIILRRSFEEKQHLNIWTNTSRGRKFSIYQVVLLSRQSLNLGHRWNNILLIL